MADESDSELPEINAEFFDEILEQDLANIVKKATNGQPLTKREREMIAEERSRLAKPSAKADFELKGEGVDAKLERMTQAKLADAWGYSVRTIKGWLADGRAAGDPCPLCQPGEMPAWFQRVHSPRQCPDKLREAAARLSADQEVIKKGAPEQPAAISERVEIPEEAKGLQAMLERLRDAEATLHGKYMLAVDAGNEQRSAFLLKEWSAIAERLRAMEKIAPETLEKIGLYVKKSEILLELETLHRAIIKTIRQGLRFGRAQLRGADTVEDWNRVTDEIVDSMCELLVNSSFAEPLTLDDAA